MADRIAVMYLGVIVELADSGEIYENASILIQKRFCLRFRKQRRRRRKNGLY